MRVTFLLSTCIGKYKAIFNHYYNMCNKCPLNVGKKKLSLEETYMEQAIIAKFIATKDDRWNRCADKNQGSQFKHSLQFFMVILQHRFIYKNYKKI